MSINERFKSLRKACNKSQEEFGKVLGLSISGISDIERSKRNVTEQHLIMLSNWKERRVNIEWLRTGEGDMFRQPAPSDEVGYYVADLLDYDGEGNPFYDIIIEMMKNYQELDEKSQAVIKEYIGKVMDSVKNKKKED